MRKELYKGIFTRIERAYPIDYYWMWTPESWLGGGTREACDAAMNDMRIAAEAAAELKFPFRLATRGWVLGPRHDTSLFGRAFPGDMTISCINRGVGAVPVEKGFKKIEGRDKWAIPWLEDDPALTAPQLWVGRMRRDAADARDYGCNGLMGIHWRTGLIGPNVAALAQAAWNQSPWKEVWDREATPPNVHGPLTGRHANYPNNPIANTDDDPLYQAVRFDVAGYRFPAPNGLYTVTLKFCDPHYGTSGSRVFGASLQGKPVIASLDIVGRVGKNAALDYTFPDIVVENGWIAIDFDYDIEFPCVAAIAIEGKDSSEKVNCGGAAYKDYKADWPPNDANYALPGTDDFYADWSRNQFGHDSALEVAAIFQSLDGVLPRPLNWITGPGNITPNATPWADVEPAYGFVEEFAALRPKVRGAGNLQRFDDWVHHFRYMKTAAELGCVLAQLESILDEIDPPAEAGEDRTKPAYSTPRKSDARERALPLYLRVLVLAKDLEGHLLATVSNIGEMGTIANFESHSYPRTILEPAARLERIFGEPLPPEARPSQSYDGPPRVFIPTRRSVVARDESIRLKVIVLSGETLSAVRLHWRPIGAGEFRSIPCNRMARGVHEVAIPAMDTETTTFEYYAEVDTPSGVVRYPVTAPEICQTVVTLD